ncbi:MAG: HEAT repeat domain-containing protein [Sterolibacteriaceae bacterium MAG5]|nr:HEAT repeat domain-containing protein [Candidatus Nitricoxidireducens bremensis]
MTSLAGYPYVPDALKRRRHSLADEFHVLLKDGGLAQAQARIAARPELLAELLPIVANPEASINVRLGASVIFENHAGGAALQALVPRLGELARHADARVRADACHYLGLSGDRRARSHLLPRLQDESAEVREIAADSLEVLPADPS